MWILSEREDVLVRLDNSRSVDVLVERLTIADPRDAFAGYLMVRISSHEAQGIAQWRTSTQEQAQKIGRLWLQKIAAAVEEGWPVFRCRHARAEINERVSS